MFYGELLVLWGVLFIVEVGKIMVFVGVLGVGKFIVFNLLICLVELSVGCVIVVGI